MRFALIRNHILLLFFPRRITGVVLSTHLSFHNSAMMGTIDLKTAWKRPVVLVVFLPWSFFLYCSSCLFFFLCFFACNLGCCSFLLFVYVVCCIFHCFVNFPLSRLSHHTISSCSSMSRSYRSYPSCHLIRIIASWIDSPLKYVIIPSCSMSHRFSSTLSLILFICL